MIERDKIIKLFEIYSSLFTDKQSIYFKDYYYEDLSLSEIAENYGVSKSIVGKTINKIEKKLEEYEKALGILKIYNELASIASVTKDKAVKTQLEELIK